MMMQALIAGAVAAIAGILVGFWLVAHLGEERSWNAEGIAADAASATWRKLNRPHGGSRPWPREREKTIAPSPGMQSKDAERLAQRREQKQLEAELRNERQNLAEKLALLETAKKALADQFQALAREILEEKSKSFLRWQPERWARCSPLKTQIKEFREKVEAGADRLKDRRDQARDADRQRWAV